MRLKRLLSFEIPNLEKASNHPFLAEMAGGGLVHQHSHPLGLMEPRGIYMGFDPTASSLHLGHLPGLLSLARASMCNLKTVALVFSELYNYLGWRSYGHDRRSLV